MALTNPKASAVNAKDIVDIRFVKELEETGFIEGCSPKIETTKPGPGGVREK
jgi:hypothetical protein